MAEKNWEPDESLDRFIYDYFVRRKLHESAKAFMAEAKVSTEPVELDAPGGFLYEWWCVFWEMHAARYIQKRSESVAAYLEAKERKAREHQQQIQMQQMQMMQQRNVPLQRRDNISPSLGCQPGGMNYNGMLGQPSPSARIVAMKLYEERMKNLQSMDSKASTGIIDANQMVHLKSSADHQGCFSQSPYVNTMGMSAALQKREVGSQLPNITDNRLGGILNGVQRHLPMDPSSVHGQALLHSNSRSCVAGYDQGVANTPLNGQPLTVQEPDQPRPNLGAQIHGHKDDNQTQILVAQSQAQGNLGNSSGYLDNDPHKFSGCPRGSLSTKNEQFSRYDTSASSPTLSSLPKMNIEREQIASSQQLDHPQQQKMQNNNKKRHPSSSGPATSTGYENTSHSPNSPSSTHLPGDGTTTTPNNHQPANSPTNMTVHHREGSPGLLSSYDQLEDINTLTDFLDENVESYYNTEGGEGKDGYNTICSVQLKAETSKDI